MCMDYRFLVCILFFVMYHPLGVPMVFPRKNKIRANNLTEGVLILVIIFEKQSNSLYSECIGFFRCGSLSDNN